MNLVYPDFSTDFTASVVPYPQEDTADVFDGEPCAIRASNRETIGLSIRFFNCSLRFGQVGSRNNVRLRSVALHFIRGVWLRIFRFGYIWIVIPAEVPQINFN